MALSFSSCVGSFSSLILVSTSWILASTVDSSVLSTNGLVASSAVCPSLITTARFWHLAHQSSPLLSLKIGEAHAGQENSVSVAPCRSRSAMVWRSLDSVVNSLSLVQKSFMTGLLFEYRFGAGFMEAKLHGEQEKAEGVRGKNGAGGCCAQCCF